MFKIRWDSASPEINLGAQTSAIKSGLTYRANNFDNSDFEYEEVHSLELLAVLLLVDPSVLLIRPSSSTYLGGCRIEDVVRNVNYGNPAAIVLVMSVQNDDPVQGKLEVPVFYVDDENQGNSLIGALDDASNAKLPEYKRTARNKRCSQSAKYLFKESSLSLATCERLCSERTDCVKYLHSSSGNCFIVGPGSCRSTFSGGLDVYIKQGVPEQLWPSDDSSQV